jgi:hypothetical protein
MCWTPLDAVIGRQTSERKDIIVKWLLLNVARIPQYVLNFT